MGKIFSFEIFYEFVLRKPEVWDPVYGRHTVEC